MPWVKIDDKLPRNPKILRGDGETAWLYVCALTHCAEQLTDGFIADSAISVLAPHIDDPRSVAARCVKVGLLRQVAGGYEVPDYLDYNPSRSKVISDRARARERRTVIPADGDASDTVPTGDDPATFQRTSPDVPATFRKRSRAPSTSTSSTSVGSQSSTGDAIGDRAQTDDDELSTAVITAIVDHQQASQTNIRHPAKWRQTATRNAATEHADRITQAITTWPTAPAALLAGWVLGDDSRNLAHYTTR